MQAEHSTAGTLYIVATPIGNLEDISSRAIRILREVDCIACEDTRHTRKLLTHFGIRTPLTSYYREKEGFKAGQLVERLLAGTDIALVSDAGTPGIADPGARLVRLARERRIRIVPIPGPSALSCALSVAGLQDATFFFGGFPPGKKRARQAFFNRLAALPCSLVFYEAPHRIAACLRDCLEILGDRQTMVFRELTKIHEECIAGPLSAIQDQVRDKVRGELVVIIAGSEDSRESLPDNLEDLIRWYRDQGDCSLRDAVHRIAADLNLSRSQVYRQALAVWNEEEPSP